MIDLLTERSLRKESTRTNLNGTPDCDDASPRKKAPLLKLDGTPVRTHDTHLRPPQEHSSHSNPPLSQALNCCWSAARHRVGLYSRVP